MDLSSFATLVSSVGFPIACCSVLFWYIKKLTDEHKTDIEHLAIKMSEMHKAETEKLAEAIANNTEVMNKLIQKIEKGD